MEDRMKLITCRFFYTEALHIIETEKLNDVDLEFTKAGCTDCRLAQSEVTDPDFLSNTQMMRVETQVYNQMGRTTSPVLQRCALLLLGNTLATHLIKQGKVLVSPGWLMNWQQQLSEMIGTGDFQVQKACLKSMGQLHLLDSGVYSNVHQQRVAFQEAMNIEMTYLPVGLDYYREKLLNCHCQWRMSQIYTQMKQKTRQISAYTLFFEKLPEAASINQMEELMDRGFDIFATLTGATRMAFRFAGEYQWGTTYYYRHQHYASELDSILKQPEFIQYRQTVNGTGFIIGIRHQEQMIGYMEIDDIPVPAYLSYYMDLAQMVGGIFALLLVNVLRNETLHRVKEEARAEKMANQAKNHFLANMSHEIRTPMNGFQGMLQLMQLTELTEEQEEYLTYAQTAADRLLRVMDDILNYSRIEAERIAFLSAAFQPAALLQETVELFEIAAKHQGNVMIMHIAEEIPLTLWGDPFKLRQVLSNLIGNAVKFTRNGRITVSLGKGNQMESNKQQLIFTVKDTGIGIDDSKLEMIFERFGQVEPVDTRRYGGTGLGLTTAKMLVEKMGGTIQVTSRKNVGSTFSFTALFDTHKTSKQA
ncbi:ATP-binding protein [Anoxynatronum sibiricum]|uniref:histidine kinase n=2 Tax=Anoxynatronum sibiricum TaxID=210623 RepID=A0ABU9VS72_9CLOT